MVVYRIQSVATVRTSPYYTIILATQSILMYNDSVSVYVVPNKASTSFLKKIQLSSESDVEIGNYAVLIAQSIASGDLITLYVRCAYSSRRSLQF